MRTVPAFATIVVGLCMTACSNKTETARSIYTEPVASYYDTALRPFYHGVASGDPLTDRVILWTRVTPPTVIDKIAVNWEIATDSLFESTVRMDTASTGPGRDFTLKVDVSGLEAGTTYYYRFTALGRTSITGRTKTLDADPDRVTLAVVSCSNWEFGYFTPYAKIAEREVDAVIHLGDYIYEYATGKYGNKAVSRKNLPAHEIVSLEDYRTRYSLYHLDAGLRKARQRHPFIAIWDDHEVANNVYVSGAQNHQAEEGDFEARKKAAQQAYYEWIPIREKTTHYRSFPFGQLAHLIMLDERLEGRTAQADSIRDPRLNSADHSMLGNVQLDWFKRELGNAAEWKIVGNQVLFSKVDQAAIYPKYPVNLDSWDGYPREQEAISNFIKAQDISNVIFITGDTHASWAFEVTPEPGKKPSKPIAVEFATPSVSSANSDEYDATEKVLIAEKTWLKANPHLKYTNHRDHGYLLLTVQPGATSAAWHYVETLLQPDSDERIGKTFTVVSGSSMLKE